MGCNRTADMLLSNTKKTLQTYEQDISLKKITQERRLCGRDYKQSYLLVNWECIGCLSVILIEGKLVHRKTLHVTSFFINDKLRERTRF